MSTFETPAGFEWDAALLNDNWEDTLMSDFSTPMAPIEPMMEPLFDAQAQVTEPLSNEQFLESALQDFLGYADPAIGIAGLPTSQYGPVDTMFAPASDGMDDALLELAGFAPADQAPPEIDYMVGDYFMQNDVAGYAGNDFANETEFDAGQELEATTAMPVGQAVDSPALQTPDFLAPTTHMDLIPDQVAADSTKIQPTAYGILTTADDARRVIKCCLGGNLPLFDGHVGREDRASLVNHGSIFCFREGSGLTRWTDGRTWSPNRDIPDFSLYREINNLPGEEKFAKPKDSRALIEVEDPQYVGVLTGNCFDFRRNGLMKKTFRGQVGEKRYKVVSYYTPLLARTLLPPCQGYFSEDNFAEIRSIGGTYKATETKYKKKAKADRKPREKLNSEHHKKIDEFKAKGDKKGLEEFLRKTTGGAISKNSKRRGLAPHSKALGHEKHCVWGCQGVVKQDGSCPNGCLQ